MRNVEDAHTQNVKSLQKAEAERKKRLQSGKTIHQLKAERITIE